MDAGAPMELPVGLAEMPPGPDLAVALAALDPTRLTARQLVVVIAAHNRQIAFQQAQLLLAVRELGLAAPQETERVVRAPGRNPYAAVEAAFAATWTAYRCDQMVKLARFAFDEAPALGEALAGGRVDLDKVRIFEHALAGVTEPGVTRAVVERGLERVGAQTTGTLRARLQRLVAKADPDSLRKRRVRDHSSRFVVNYPEPSGLVTLQARFCDPAAASAALEHLDALAKATKAAGDARGRTMDQLRHDIALNLLAGVDPASAGIATSADRKGAVILHIDLATLVGIRGLLGTSTRPCLGLCGVGVLHEDGELQHHGERQADRELHDHGIGCGLCRRALAELTSEPGIIAGYGPVTAHIARQTAAQLANSCTWRYAVADDGQLIAEGALPKDLVPGLIEQMRRWAVDATAGPDGRAHRLPTSAQVAFVRARDRRCQAPGCRVPAHKCQIDHRIPWHRGGPTFIENLHCLCLRHHRAKDDGGHRYRPVAGGIAWTTPAGHHYVTIRDGRRLRPAHQRPRGIVLVDLRSHRPARRE